MLTICILDICAIVRLISLYNDTVLWLQKSHPALFDHTGLTPSPLRLAVSKRTVFHELAITDPTKVRNAIALNFVSYESDEVSQARKKKNIPWTFVFGIRMSDTYGWKPSDYLVAKGAIDSLLLICVWIMSAHHIDGVDSGGTERSNKMPSVDSSWIARCSELFAGPENVLTRVPPELSATLGGTDWPEAGKSPRRLAQDLGHEDIVELIDFIAFHEEGSSLLSYVESKTAFKEGSFAAVKLASKTFFGFAEAGPANSK